MHGPRVGEAHVVQATTIAYMLVTIATVRCASMSTGEESSSLSLANVLVAIDCDAETACTVASAFTWSVTITGNLSSFTSVPKNFKKKGSGGGAQPPGLYAVPLEQQQQADDTVSANLRPTGFAHEAPPFFF